MPITFRFNEAKAVQAAAFLLILHHGKMQRLRLMKLLYVAEREQLKRYGRPIIGDHYVSMDYGPVLSNTLNLARETGWIEGKIWKKYIKKLGKHSVKLLHEPRFDKLTPAERTTLQRVHKERLHQTQWQISKWTHLFGEWQDPHGSSMPIHVEDVLREVGKTEKEIREIEKDTAERAHFDRLFESRL